MAFFIKLLLSPLVHMIPIIKKQRHHNESAPAPAHNSYQVKESSLCNKVFHTHLFKYYVAAKATLENYHGLTNPMKHIHNVRSTLELVTIKSHAMCKVFPTIFYGFTMMWYHSLKPESILGLHDLYVKLISPFSSNISAKKSTTKLFVIT